MTVATMEPSDSFAALYIPFLTSIVYTDGADEEYDDDDSDDDNDDDDDATASVETLEEDDIPLLPRLRGSWDNAELVAAAKYGWFCYSRRLRHASFQDFIVQFKTSAGSRYLLPRTKGGRSIYRVALPIERHRYTCRIRHYVKIIEQYEVHQVTIPPLRFGRSLGVLVLAVVPPKKLQLSHEGECAVVESLTGMTSFGANAGLQVGDMLLRRDNGLFRFMQGSYFREALESEQPLDLFVLRRRSRSDDSYSSSSMESSASSGSTPEISVDNSKESDAGSSSNSSDGAIEGAKIKVSIAGINKTDQETNGIVLELDLSSSNSESNSESNALSHRKRRKGLKRRHHSDDESSAQRFGLQYTSIPTYQGRIEGSINGCTVISFLCVRHFLGGILDTNAIQHVIDHECIPILRRLRGNDHAFLELANVLVEFNSDDLFADGVQVGGNLMDDRDLRRFVKQLKYGESNESITATQASAAVLFLRGKSHVISVLKLVDGDSVSFDVVDSLNDGSAGYCTRTHCPDGASLMELMKALCPAEARTNPERWTIACSSEDHRTFSAYVWMLSDDASSF